MSRLKKILQTKNRVASQNANNTIRHLSVKNGKTELKIETFLPSAKPTEFELNPHKDIRSATDATRFVNECDKVFDKLTEATRDSAEQLMSEIGDNVYCAKSGHLIFANIAPELLTNYALMENSQDAGKHTLSLFTHSIAPHFVNTSPEQMDKLRIVDPCGLFVYLSARICGEKRESFDKAQGKCKDTQKRLMFVKERAKTFEIINEYALTGNEAHLKIAVCNDLMLKTLALASHKGFYREFRKFSPLFVSLTNCAKDIDTWAEWVKAMLNELCDKLASGGKRTDVSETGMLRKAQIMEGDTAMRSVVTSDINGRGLKRQWLKRKGIDVVVLNSMLDTITEEELLMPKLVNGAWPIDKLNDEDLKKKIHNNLLIKTRGKASEIRGTGDKAQRARKKLQKAVELDDFMDLAGIKPIYGEG